MNATTFPHLDPLPFAPEPFELLRARFPAALTRVWVHEEIAANPAERPGVHREHVFDDLEGKRLVIAVVKIGPDVSLLVSFSHLHAAPKIKLARAIVEVSLLNLDGSARHFVLRSFESSDGSTWLARFDWPAKIQTFAPRVGPP